MKKLLILLLLTPTIAFTQHEGYIQVWKHEAKYFNPDTTLPDSLDAKINRIFTSDSIKYPTFGRYNTKSKNILLSDFIYADINIAKLTIYHEIGHALGLEHSYDLNSIMVYTPPYNFAPYSNEWYWYYLTEKYFAKLEYLQKNPSKRFYLD